MDKVRIGVVGCGVIANNTYLPGITGMAEKAELVAVCDVQGALAERAAQRFGARETYTDYERMLTQAPVDAVVVLTNIQSHAANVLAALQAGKHVYTEKTMATNLPDADRCIAEAEERNLLLACAPPVMLSAVNQRVKGLIAQGAIGRVNFVRARHSHGGPANSRNWGGDPTWFYKAGAGPILDLGVYAFHELTGILGPVKRVTSFAGIAMPERPIRSGPAQGKTIQVEVEDNALTLLDFGNSTFAVVDSTYCVQAAKGPRTEFYGSSGTININERRGEQPPIELYREDETLDLRGWMPVPIEGARGWSLASGVEHLADCIREGRKPVISATHARHCLEVMLKSMEAARTGVAQEVSTTF
ncbi:MAG TPA: Gfo/Idh/MocA family oxidoreductase [Chloroflexota bacterium]|jgi:predicted dehydrogenase|nr:Gfo/Idh/MocA family oxidoreductase [Chloroflexota bacterium]